MTTEKRYYLLQLVCSAFIFLFVYTALSKFHHFSSFVHVLANSPLIGLASTILAWAIPLMELGVSILLLLPFTRRIGLYAALILMSVFTVYVGYMVLFVPHLPCSCGGVIQQMSWKEHLLFNFFFSGLAVWGIVLTPKEKEQKDQQAKCMVFT